MGVICCICVCCHSIHFCVGNSAGCYVSWICGNVCGNDGVSCVLGSDVCFGDKGVCCVCWGSHVCQEGRGICCDCCRSVVCWGGKVGGSVF